MLKLNYQDICDMLVGATFLASGGGGPLDISMKMLEEYKDAVVEMYDDNEVSNDKYAAIVAAMGAPSEASKRDFNKILTHTIEFMKREAMALDEPKEVRYILPIEFGGFNTFAPIYLALLNPDIKLLNADGSGRAVPGLNTTLVSINGASITPFVMANENNDCIDIQLADAKDATSCEEVCRSLCSSSLYQSISGVAGWLMKPQEVNDYAISNDLSYALRVGQCIRRYKEESASGRCQEKSIFRYMQNHDPSIEVKSLADNEANLTVFYKSEVTSNGSFDVGKIYIIESNNPSYITMWEIHFINESLVVYKHGEPYMTAPDIVCIFDEETKMPLSNDYILAHNEELCGRKISLGVMPVNEKWWSNRNKEQMTTIWRKYFDAVDYEGSCIAYRDLK